MQIYCPNTVFRLLQKHSRVYLFKEGGIHYVDLLPKHSILSLETFETASFYRRRNTLLYGIIAQTQYSAFFRNIRQCIFLKKAEYTMQIHCPNTVFRLLQKHSRQYLFKESGIHDMELLPKHSILPSLEKCSRA